MRLNKLLATGAQITLAVIILPFAAILIRIIMPEEIGSFVFGLLEEIPVVNVISNLIETFTTNDFSNSVSVLENTLNTVYSTMLVSCIVGFCTFIFVRLGYLVKIKGLPILQNICGIFASCVLLKFFGNTNDQILVCAIILAVITFAVAIINSRSVVKAILDICVGSGFSIIGSATMSAYCSVLVLIFNKSINSVQVAINALIWTLIPALICLLLDYLFFSEK